LLGNSFSGGLWGLAATLAGILASIVPLAQRREASANLKWSGQRLIFYSPIEFPGTAWLTRVSIQSHAVMRRSSLAAKCSFAAVRYVLLRALLPHEPTSIPPLLLLWPLFLRYLNRPGPNAADSRSDFDSLSIPEAFGSAVANAQGIGLKAW